MIARPKQYLDDRSWHLDKRVPIAIIFSLLVQSGSVIWWSASVSERLTAVERKVDMTAPQADRLTRLEVNVESIKDSVNEIKATIRKRP